MHLGAFDWATILLADPRRAGTTKEKKRPTESRPWIFRSTFEKMPGQRELHLRATRAVDAKRNVLL